MLTIREEIPADSEIIRAINRAAFGQPQEADIVDALRGSCFPFISLLAEIDGTAAGHVLFTPIRFESGKKTIAGLGLAPMAVLPAFQRRGLGSALVKAGIEQIKNMRIPFIAVLGHPDYYPRFGFEPASRYGIKCAWEVPDEAFMILILDKKELRGLTGIVKYRPEFNAAV